MPAALQTAQPFSLAGRSERIDPETMRPLFDWVLACLTDSDLFWHSPAMRWIAHLGVLVTVLLSMGAFLLGDRSSRSFTTCLAIVGLSLLVWIPIEVGPLDRR